LFGGFKSGIFSLLLTKSFSLINIELGLLKYSPQLVTVKSPDKILVRDPVRKILTILTPEETVRQLLILFLFEKYSHLKNLISVEKELKINFRKKRFDLLIYDRQMKPFLLVECKAPSIKITQAVFDQVSWYNVALNAPFLLVTNGISTYCAKIDFDKKTYNFSDYLPLDFENL